MISTFPAKEALSENVLKNKTRSLFELTQAAKHTSPAMPSRQQSASSWSKPKLGLSETFDNVNIDLSYKLESLLRRRNSLGLQG